jgi:hypothetical protein
VHNRSADDDDDDDDDEDDDAAVDDPTHPAVVDRSDLPSFERDGPKTSTSSGGIISPWERKMGTRYRMGYSLFFFLS